MIDRPTWPEYYMKQAELVATRSPDPATRHGCIITDAMNRPLSQGYNCWPRGGSNDVYPTDRPDKYLYMLHAEVNAILHVRGRADNGRCYVTGHPCANCFAMLIQIGIKTVVFGARGSAMVDEIHRRAVKLMANNHNVEIYQFRE